MPHDHVRRPIAAVITTAALITAALAWAPPATGAVSVDAPVVISEVYGGGGNASAVSTATSSSSTTRATTLPT